MSIVVICPGRKVDYWIDALKETDPEVEVLTHEQVRENGSVIYALAWDQPPGIFSRYPNLRCVSSLGAGADHLVRDPDIPDQADIVRIIDPRLSDDLFEFSLAVVMNRLRSLTRYKVKQLEKKWEKKLYNRIEDLSIGIMGTGVIGGHVAEKLCSLGFSVNGWSRSGDRPGSYCKYAGKEEMEAFLENTDILICILPLTDSTKGILNKENLMKLPEKSYLVNLGRGGHLVDNDLIELLDSGHLSGASLDVFHFEPLPEDHPFWEHPGIDITPHVASITDPSKVAPQIIENYHRVKKGIRPKNTVSKEKGY